MWTKWSAVNEWRLLEPKSESKSEAFFLSPEWSASTTCLCIDGSVANSVNSRPALWNESYWLLYLQIIINKVIGGQLNREYQLWRWDFERNGLDFPTITGKKRLVWLGKRKKSENRGNRWERDRRTWRWWLCHFDLQSEIERRKTLALYPYICMFSLSLSLVKGNAHPYSYSLHLEYDCLWFHFIFSHSTSFVLGLGLQRKLPDLFG